MRGEMVGFRFTFLRVGYPCRFVGLFWLLWSLVPMQSSPLAAAQPGLHPDPIIGPLASFFEQASAPSMLQPGDPLLRMRMSANLFENRVEVDSLLVTYKSFSGGFHRGPDVSMHKEHHLDLTYLRESRQLWRQKIRRGFRTAAAEKRQRGARRLEWSVPFTTPKPLRRFIGDEGPTLRMKGQLKVGISGKSQWTSNEVQTTSGRPSKFPALGVDQEQRFTVEGKVGELINVRIDQDTENLDSAFGSNFGDQIANQIKLDYKGKEDAIFKEIQAGNTTLSLPQSRFVDFSQQHKGLFGVRAKGVVGPLDFTAIASHEKSKSNRQTFKGGAAQDTLSLKDHQYLRNTYFFLDQFYRDNLPDYRRLAQGQQIRNEDVIDANSLQVYVNDFDAKNDAELLAKEGVAWADFNDLREESGWVERGTWHRLDPDNDYSVVLAAGFIVLHRAVPGRHALAVIYRTQDGRQFGNAQTDPLELKLIKARAARPDFPTWDLEWKNVYRIATSYSPGRKFDTATIEVQIFKEIPGKEPEPSQGRSSSYLQILGLDEHGQDPGSRPDRLIDKGYIGLDELRGHLIFPARTPFNPTEAEDPGSKLLKDKIPRIYTSHQRRDWDEASRYTIEVRSSSTQQRINLGLGVRPETVVVRLNGQRKQLDVDYNISSGGDITFVGSTAQEVADPGAELEISYESKDLLSFGSQQKTLLGLRTQYEFLGGDGYWGGTMIYNNERSSERRVRVGQEPARTVVWSMDVRAKFGAPFLTRVVDALPLLKTATPSSFEVRAEVAQGRPNLNTRGKGFIDDFEGSENPSTLRIGRTQWTPASLPANSAYGEENRGELIWYNPFEGVLRTEIWPGQEEQLESQDKQTDILVLELTPRPEAPTSWGAVMSSLGGANGEAKDYSRSKFLDLWVRGSQGSLHIDLGTISEDFIANGVIDTEDESKPGLPAGDGILAPKEDIGIDGRNDQTELNYYLNLAGADTTGSTPDKKESFRQIYPERDPEDPEGDNWSYNPDSNKNDYSRINGTEGNRVDRETGVDGRPDSEDLNGDTVLNLRNDYFHYTIDLANDPHVPGTESNGWRLFRLPLYADTERAGNPDSSLVEYARLMVSGSPARPEQTVMVEIALMEVVGNEWQEDDIAILQEGFEVGADEAFNVTVIGTAENTEYKPPPGVKIRRKAQGFARETEQSLVLAYENLEPGHQASATKILTRNANYTKYTRLRMFVHGDDVNTEYVQGDSSDLELFVRFGADSTNYYEFAGEVFPGWEGEHPGQENEVDIDLLEIAQLKARLQDLLSDSSGQHPSVLDTVIARPNRRNGVPATYRVRGNPSMQQIRQLTIGLRNKGPMQAYSGQVLVDELRLEDVRNDAGLAAFAKVNTKMADFVNLDGEVQWMGGNFRTLNSTERTATDLTTALSTTAHLNRFLPGRWGFAIPLKATFNEKESLPRFGPNADVELTSEEKRRQRGRSARQFYELSLSKRSGRNWLLRWTIDQVNLRLSHLSEHRKDQIRPLDRTDAQTMNFNYKMPLPSPMLSIFAWLPDFMPQSVAKLRWRYLPSNLTYSVAASRREKSSRQRTETDTTFQETFGLKETYVAKVNPFTGTTGDYNLQIDRDLRKKYSVDRLSFGREIRRRQKADVKFTPRLVRWLDQSYTFGANYEENSDPSQRRAQVVVDSTTGLPFKTRDVTTRNNLSARFNLKLPAILKSIAGSSGSSKGGRRVAGSRDGGNGENGDTATAGEARIQRGPFFLWRLFHFAGGFIEPVSATWRRNGSARSFNLNGRPSVLYQIGLEDSLEVERATVGLTQQDQFNHTSNLDIGSGVKLPMGVSVKTNLDQKLTRRSGSTQKRLRLLKERRFPKTSLTWGRANRLPFIKRYIHSAHVNVSYQETRSQEGEGSLVPGNLITEGNSREIRVSWNGKWGIGPSTKIETVVSRGTELDFELVGDAAGEGEAAEAEEERPLRGSGSNQKRSTTFRVNYNLRPRSIPLFGKLKSDVDLKFEFTRETETRSKGTGYAERVPISGMRKWRGSLTASYKFSESFRGDGLIRIQDELNQLTEKTRKSREVKFSGTMFFR